MRRPAQHYRSQRDHPKLQSLPQHAPGGAKCIIGTSALVEARGQPERVAGPVRWAVRSPLAGNAGAPTHD
jgi:hypothetical protein